MDFYKSWNLIKKVIKNIKIEFRAQEFRTIDFLKIKNLNHFRFKYFRTSKKQNNLKFWN